MSNIADLIRMDVVSYAPPLDEFDNPMGAGRQEIITRRFPILSYTPCGAWIDVYGERRFVNLRAVKQFACASEGEARVALRCRKERQARILTAQLANVERALQLLQDKPHHFGA